MKLRTNPSRPSPRDCPPPAETGFTVNHCRFAGTITVPLALDRARTTTYGSTRAGDAAFADWSPNPSFTIRF